MHIFSFPNTIYQKAVFFLMSSIGFFIKSQVVMIYMILPLRSLFYPLDLCLCFFACTVIFVSTMQQKIRYCTSAAFTMCRIDLAIQGLLCYHMNFSLFFFISVKNRILILIGIELNLQIALRGWPFSHYYSCYSTSIKAVLASKVFFNTFLQCIFFIVKIFNFLHYVYSKAFLL